jgi:hypothetical protein
VREPSENHAVASFRVNDRKPGVAAGIFVGGQQSTGAEGLELAGRSAQINGGRERPHAVGDRRLGAAIG